MDSLYLIHLVQKGKTPLISFTGSREKEERSLEFPLLRIKSLKIRESVSMQTITREDLKLTMQPSFVAKVPDEAIEQINALINDPDMGDFYHENMVTYQKILSEGRYKTEHYLNAIKYCSHIVKGDSQKEAYAHTFPDRIKYWDTIGKVQKDRANLISAYQASQLVQKILSQAMVPVWLMNQDLYQKALNTQAELMQGSNSDMVRHLAAKTVLETLKRPEEAKLSIDINQKETTFMKELKDAVQDLVIAQKRGIESGLLTVKEAAEAEIKIGTNSE